MAIDRMEYRRTIGTFATGVTIITTKHGEHAHGLTANAVSSVSLEPTLVLVCVDHTSDTFALLKETGVFCVNVLGADQADLSTRFATKLKEGEHRMEGINYREAPTGAPILEGCIAYLDCRIWQTYTAGDHDIFIGEVIDIWSDPGDDAEPLLFYRGKYRTLAPA